MCIDKQKIKYINKYQFLTLVPNVPSVSTPDPVRNTKRHSNTQQMGNASVQSRNWSFLSYIEQRLLIGPRHTNQFQTLFHKSENQQNKHPNVRQSQIWNYEDMHQCCYRNGDNFICGLWLNLLISLLFKFTTNCGAHRCMRNW